MNFPSSRLLRSSPLVPSRALFHNFSLPSSSSSSSLPSILLPVPRVPTQTSRSVHNPQSSKFFLFIEGRRLAEVRRTSKPRFFLLPPPFSSSSFFLLLLLLLQNRTDGRAFPPRLFASCAPRLSSTNSSIDETATRLEKYPPPLPLPRLFASITSRRRRESLPRCPHCTLPL